MNHLKRLDICDISLKKKKNWNVYLWIDIVNLRFINKGPNIIKLLSHITLVLKGIRVIRSKQIFEVRTSGKMGKKYKFLCEDNLRSLFTFVHLSFYSFFLPFPFFFKDFCILFYFIYMIPDLFFDFFDFFFFLFSFFFAFASFPILPQVKCVPPPLRVNPIHTSWGLRNAHGSYLIREVRMEIESWKGDSIVSYIKI